MSSNPPNLNPSNHEVVRRRTFAIISHPDAGKTTLTEKFLLYGGAIQLAGQVRAKGEARRTRSDFMQMEKDRGISVSASAMSFDFDSYRYNLVDTPGHSDFSEDTYRTLTAVDSAIMVIDGAKGVESQTQKLFEVCRLRDLPIFTFCNKMDRESRDTFEIIDEIPLRRASGGFDRLLSTIVSQQLSVAAADAIWKKMKLARLNKIQKIKEASDQELREVGLSKQKIKYVRSLANAKINYNSLKTMPTSEVISELTKVSGIGNWTAEIYAMFSLGRANVFAPGDLALQEATRLLFDLADRPSEKKLRLLAKDWSPWQAVAARLLWSYYNHQKNGREFVDSNT